MHTTEEKKEPQQVTLESIAAQLTRIESQLHEKEVAQKKDKDWKDLQELGGLALLIVGLVYLFSTGGVGAIISWLKGLVLPG